MYVMKRGWFDNEKYLTILTISITDSFLAAVAEARVARWHIFEPKWVNLGGSCNRRC
jgi:hypothetical protein